MRVLQIHTAYRRPGGEDAVADSEAAVLRAAGHEVVEWRAANSSAAPRAAAQLAAAPWNPLAARQARRLARRVRPDVVHVHNTWFALSHSVIGAIRAAGFPTVATLHNYRLICANALLYRDGHVCEDCVGSAPLPAVRHRCYRDSYPQSAAAAAAIEARRRGGEAADRLLVLNEFSRSLFQRAGLPAERLRVKPNFAPDPGERTRRPSGSRRVLFVGRLAPEKGVETLLDAWSQARPAGLELTVVGDGPLRSAAEAADVEVAPWMPRQRIDRLLLDSRALLIPSRWYEGQPRVALEGMAAGLPVLGSALGGLGELLAPSGDGCAVPDGPSGWAAALARLEDDAWVDRTGSAARDRYLGEFDERAGLRGLESAYAEVV